MPPAPGTMRLAVIAAALSCVATSPAGAETPLERRGERLVKKAIGAELPVARFASCRTASGARRGRKRLSCRYRGSRRLSPNRTRMCRGRYGALITRRGLRLRRSGRRRCELRVEAVDPWLGFNDNAVRAGQLSAEEDARLTEGVGAGIHRLTFDWRYAEPQRDRYVLEEYDRIYATMLARGVRPLFILMFAPRWAWGPLPTCSGDCRFPPARGELAEWRQIAALLATRYPRAAGIEIWNEPNDVRFWNEEPDSGRYAELLVEAYKAVKEANPSMQVVTGGFANPSPEYGIGLHDFLSGVFQAGAARSFDALAFHVYPSGASLAGLAPTLDIVRSLRDRFRADGPPLWVTETGFTTSGPQPPGLTEADQAVSLVNLYRTFRGQPDVQAVVINSLLESSGDRTSPNAGYGIVRFDLTKKPAYCELARELWKGAPCQ